MQTKNLRKMWSDENGKVVFMWVHKTKVRTFQKLGYRVLYKKAKVA